MRTSRPILVTGIHRCGSTFTGRMLELASQVQYLAEPFNFPLYQPRCPISRWYQMVTPENCDRIAAYLRESFGLTRRHESTAADLIKQWVARGREILSATRHISQPSSLFRSLRNLLEKPRLLVKDPFFVFSAEWFEKSYDAQVVVLIRHPAAVASSLLRLGWSFDMRDLAHQPELMDTHLAPFREEIEHLCKTRDVLDEAILLWKCIYHTVLKYQLRHPNWIFVRHEDLSLRPIEEFERLYDRLNLRFTKAIRHQIELHTSHRNQKELPLDSPHDVHLDSRTNVKNWLGRLSAKQTERVRQGTESVARHFYKDADWEGHRFNVGGAPLQPDARPLGNSNRAAA